MTLGSPWGHDGKTYAGQEMRELVDAIFGGQTGIVGANDFLVEQQASPGNTVKVRAGNIVIAATGAGLFGKYAVPNDASINSPTIAPTSTNGRKDRLIVRVTSGVAALEVVQGVASGSPAEPTITGDNFEELALITLPGSTTNITTAMLTDRRKRASTTNGFVICTSSTRPSAPWPGLHIYETDTGAVLFWDGSAWKRTSGNIPHSGAVRRQFAADIALSNPTTYTRMSAGADRTALSLPFTKYRADTKLILALTGTCYISSGAAQEFYIGLTPDANTTKWDVAEGYFSATNAHTIASGFNEITGVAAGSYTVEPIFKTAGAAALKTFAGNDNLAFTVAETL